jgi:hypothetical protein
MRDYDVKKAVESLPQLRRRRHLCVQQGVLETFVDRGELRQGPVPSRRSRGQTDRRAEEVTG